MTSVGVTFILKSGGELILSSVWPFESCEFFEALLLFFLNELPLLKLKDFCCPIFLNDMVFFLLDCPLGVTFAEFLSGSFSNNDVDSFTESLLFYDYWSRVGVPGADDLCYWLLLLLLLLTYSMFTMLDCFTVKKRFFCNSYLAALLSLAKPRL